MLAQITPGSPSAVNNVPATPANGSPSASFSLQATTQIGSTSQDNFAVYANVGGGLTGLTFNHFGTGVPLNLDADGHLLGIGPTNSGQTVAYVATFQIGATQGPVALMFGTIDPSYVPIVCRILSFSGGDDPLYVLSCRDGANGANMMLQKCAGNFLYLGTTLGTTLGTGCMAQTFQVYYTGT